MDKQLFIDTKYNHLVSYSCMTVRYLFLLLFYFFLSLCEEYEDYVALYLQLKKPFFSIYF